MDWKKLVSKFGGKMTREKWLFLLLLGVILMILSMPFPGNSSKSKGTVPGENVSLWKNSSLQENPEEKGWPDQTAENGQGEPAVRAAAAKPAADYEKEHSKDNVVEQIIRPTGLLDPKIEVKPVTNQIDDLLEQIRLRIEKKERVLVTTLTKKMAEDLTEYLKSLDIKVNYIHSDTKALERMKIIRDLRLGEFDVLVGINLLREGLDIPEVSLVAILDADKEGFLRSERSLIQTIGRAARNTDGTVIMYADELTESMEKAISETNRRRKIQEEYNKKNGIIPKTIKKSVRDNIKVTDVKDIEVEYKLEKSEDIKETISKLTDEMLKCATEMEFEKAAELRDKIRELEKLI